MFVFFSLRGKFDAFAFVKFPKADLFLRSPGGDASAFLLLVPFKVGCGTNIAVLDLELNKHVTLLENGLKTLIKQFLPYLVEI